MNSIIKWYLGIGLGHLALRLVWMAINGTNDPLIEAYKNIEGDNAGFKKAAFGFGVTLGLISNVLIWPYLDVKGVIDGIKEANQIKKERSAE